MANESIAPLRFASASFTTVGTAAATPGIGPGINDPALGDFCEEGGRRYVFCYNDGGASAAVGLGCVLNSGATGYSVTVSAATSTDYLIGVVRNSTFITGAYAWLVVRGFTNVQMIAASSTVLTRGNLELGANGNFAPASNTTGNGPVVGQATATIVTGASGQAFISCFG